MRRFRIIGVGGFPGLAAAIIAISMTGLAGAAEPPEKILEGLGLSRSGDLFIVPSESRTKSKTREIRQLMRLISLDSARLRETASPEDYQKMIKGLTDQVAQYRNEINTVGQQLNSFPRWRGRFLTTDATAQYQQLSAYRAQLQAEVNEETAYLNQLKSQPPDPKVKSKLDAELSERRDSLRTAIKELRELVDETRAKYAELAANPEVKGALEKLAAGARTRPKLGPAHEFLVDVKYLEKIEKDENAPPDAAAPATPKRSRAKRSTLKSKRAPVAADAPASSGKAADPGGN
jgi:hypothetical protein